MLSDPRISVVITCFNQARFLPASIDSLLKQTHPPDEVVVIDDGSTDTSANVAAKYNSQIRYIFQQNTGVALARNHGVLETTGDFILFMDGDDWIDRSYFEKHLETLQRHPHGDAFYSTVQYADEQGNFIPGGWLPVPFGDNVYCDLIHSNRIGTMHAVLLRREALAKTSLFDPTLKSAEDWDLWIQLARAGCQFIPSPDAVCVYRQVQGSASRNFRRQRLASMRILEKQRLSTADRKIRKLILARERYFQGKILADELKYCLKMREWRAMLKSFASTINQSPAVIGVMTGRLISYVGRHTHLMAERMDQPWPSDKPASSAGTNPLNA